jgi:hypothetical protein
MSTTENLEKLIVQEQEKFLMDSSFYETSKKLKEFHTPQKSAYSFPMMDTIGRLLYEQIQSTTKSVLS